MVLPERPALKDRKAVKEPEVGQLDPQALRGLKEVLAQQVQPEARAHKGLRGQHQP